MTTKEKFFTAENVGVMLFNTLLLAAQKRNRDHPNKPEIYVQKQVDDPPGMFKIDVDFPTEGDAVKNKYLCRLHINLETEEVTFFPDGYRQDPEIYLLTSRYVLMNQMIAIIQTS